MTDLHDLFTDIDVALDSLVASGNEADTRRCGRAVLGALFEVREHLRAHLGSGTYWTAVDLDSSGGVAEGIVAMRGRMTHGPLQDIRPNVQVLHPGEGAFPSDDLFPGGNLSWLMLDQMASADRDELRKRDKGQRYADHVAGLTVLSTLREARDFFRRLATSAS